MAVSVHSSVAWGAEPAALPAANRAGVVHLVLSLNPGGTEQLVVEMCRRIGPRFRTAICCLDEAGLWGEELARGGTAVLALNRRPGFRPSLGIAVAQFAGRFGAKIIHCHHYSPFVYGRLAKLASPGLQVVFTEHGRYSDGPPIPKRKAVNPWLARIPGPIYAVSGALRAHMIDEGFPASRIGVIHNGIDPGRVPGEFERRRARAALGASDDTFLVGTAARLDPVKDLPTLIAAFDEVRRRVPQSRLVIAGDGAERPALEREVRERGLSNAVALLGHRDDVRRLLPALDAYVNSSISEGISITILEAMAAAVPIVATRVGGTPEIVSDERNGLLVPARSAEAVARALLSLAFAPSRRQALAMEGRRTVEREFRLDRMVDAYARVYSELAG